jgi:hypothetical protein
MAAEEEDEGVPNVLGKFSDGWVVIVFELWLFADDQVAGAVADGPQTDVGCVDRH